MRSGVFDVEHNKRSFFVNIVSYIRQFIGGK